ncbi:MAG TPA: polyamine aminopropyltransferase [Acidiferrobacteraceae bacterium]|nr:polyamine aminopropyltransferase [Acidiferrobacteraceae bacterium]
MESLWNMWFTELHHQRVGLSLKVSRVLYSEYSDFQRIDVIDTEQFGRALVLYGSIMITEKDEFVYHEMLSHVPLHVHPKPEKVLIIGGGDGGALREVTKHDGVQQATMVEIDKQVVEVCKQYFPKVGGFDHPKSRVVIDDGAAFVANTDEKFDVILADTSDPIGPAEVLFQKPFYQSVYDCLNDDGIFVPQSESPLYHQDSVTKIYRNLKSVFPIVRMYLAHIPTYPSALWSFAFCSKKYDPLEDFYPGRVVDMGFNYYNADIHCACFALPGYVKELVSS